MSVTPFIKKVDKDGNEVEVKELWIPIHSVITDDTIDSQISYGGGPPKRVPHHKQNIFPSL